MAKVLITIEDDDPETDSINIDMVFEPALERKGGIDLDKLTAAQRFALGLIENQQEGEVVGIEIDGVPKR